MSATSPGQWSARPIKAGRYRHTAEVDLPEPQTQREQANTGHRASYTVISYCALALILFLITPSAQASFIGTYSLANFTMTKSDSVGGLSGTNGFAMSPDGGLSVVLTGGNSGSGFGGMTDLVIHAAASGLVQFQYSYSSLDAPGFDSAGYLLTNNFFLLSDTNGVCNGAACPGTVQFSVSVGQSFGFRVKTMDNQSGPGILTVSNFSAPDNTSTSVPDPGYGPVMAVLFATSEAAQLWRSRHTNRGTA